MNRTCPACGFKETPIDRVEFFLNPHHERVCARCFTWLLNIMHDHVMRTVQSFAVEPEATL